MEECAIKIVHQQQQMEELERKEMMQLFLFYERNHIPLKQRGKSFGIPHLLDNHSFSLKGKQFEHIYKDDVFKEAASKKLGLGKTFPKATFTHKGEMIFYPNLFRLWKDLDLIFAGACGVLYPIIVDCLYF